ncbi:MAG TPA: DUF4268 domain-containing protein [Niabella sp.]|nr:DUF4268 domain-containing protein [Niabella sp.]HOZ95799.1 DUF4268 domain-containing protein [Niabella sp.]HQW13653.1 DUF4268 domain-containing protein [Niabella sp.]HQX19047.1 DUF4268 domain-containing protein [Niabella sp.]HQX42014.1 DUF4268 domain-containing protein [Niabella sp.]
MYSKSEASNIRKTFWTAFGKYMKPIKDAEGNSINWINYKTGVRHIYFRMDADKRKATVSIEIKHLPKDTRLEYFAKFEMLKSYFSKIIQEQWHWQQKFYDEDGSEASRIMVELEPVNIFRQEDWPAIISFFKERIVLLDRFWKDVKFQFESGI